jgi:hypothetical protein
MISHRVRTFHPLRNANSVQLHSGLESPPIPTIFLSPESARDMYCGLTTLKE